MATTDDDPPAGPPPAPRPAHWLRRLWRHRRLDDADVEALLPPAALTRLEARVAASEAQHHGEIRLCVEAGLPLSYLRRGLPVRERALMMFSKLRVWDTEANTGVLVYLLLADHAIEIVADRGLARQVDSAEWQALLAPMRAAFREGRFEDGLAQAIDRLDALMRERFPARPGERNPDELPNRAFVL